MRIRKTITQLTFIILMLFSGVSAFAQQADSTVNQNTIKRLVHWVSVFTMYSDLDLSDKVDLAEYAEAADIAAGFVTNPELSAELAKFRAATFVNVYPKGMMGGEQWITTKLNQVSDAQYSSLNAPYITMEVWFTPVDNNTGYLTKVILKPSEGIKENITSVQEQINNALSAQKFASPREAKTIVNDAIIGGLTQLQDLLGLSYAPNIAIRFEDKLYLNGQTIETWQRTDGLTRLEAVDRNGNLLTGSLTWTGVRGSGNTVDFLSNEVRTDYVTLKSGDDPIRVTVKVKEFTLDVNELLKRLIVETLSAKKKQATDSLVRLRQDSIANVNSIGQLIASLEKDNFPMESTGASFTPLFTEPVTLTDSTEFQNNSDKANSLREIKKRKRLAKAIKREFNIEAFADLVAKNPDQLKVVLDDLLNNSGELIANLILGQDSEGQENIARNIVVDYINQNMQRYVDAYAPEALAPEQPLPVAQSQPTAQTFDPARHVYMSPHVQFEGRQAFIQQLEDSLKNQSPPMYAFINYSQDISSETYQSREGGNKPVGLPEGTRYATITLVNIPGSVKYQLFYFSSSGTRTSFSPREGVKENIFAGLFEDAEEGAIYQTDGHYWTVYLVAMLLGIEDQISGSIAYAAEYPDGVVIDNQYAERYSWMKKEDQKDTHVLNGRFGPDVTQETVDQIKKVDKYNFEELGRLIHRLGDSFAHRKLDGSNYLYGRDDNEATLQHFLWDFSEPDLIKNRPGLYEEYVNLLADVFIDKYEEARQINKLQVWNKTHELAMYATTNKISLLGIINYEVAKLRNMNTFIVHINISYLPGQKRAHDAYVANTRKYLSSKGVEFSTQLTDYGTIFTLIN